MKKWVSFIAMVLTLCMLCAACAQPAAAPQAAESTAQAAAPSTDTAAAEASSENAANPEAAAEFVIKLGHGNDPVDTSWYHRYTMLFKEKVEEYSNGRIRVEEYPSFQLGDEQEMMRSVSLGTQEATLGAMNNYNVYVPSMGFFTLPYIFDNTQQARAVMDSMMPDLIQNSVESANCRLLGVLDAGFRVLTSNKPVKNLDDLRKLKVRVAENPIMISTFEAWGVSPIPLAWSETYTALQQGVADAHDNALNAITSNKIYEVQKYITDINYLIQTNVLILNEDFYQSLPKELQEAVDKAANDVVEYSRELTDSSVEEDRSFLKEQGIEMLGAPEDLENWVSAAKTIWPKFYELIGSGDAAKGEEIITKVEEYKKSVTN